MSHRDHQTGSVLLLNPRQEMDYDNNPRKKKKKAARKAAKRSNPKKRHRRRSSASAAPRSNPKRGRRRKNPARMKARRVRHRRNPGRKSGGVGFVSIMKDAPAAITGGALSFGAVRLAREIPVKNVYGQLSISAAAPVVVATGAAALGLRRISHGAMGAFGFLLPGLAIAGWNHYQATKATPQPQPGAQPQPGVKGFGVGMPANVGMPATARVRR